MFNGCAVSVMTISVGSFQLSSIPNRNITHHWKITTKSGERVGTPLFHTPYTFYFSRHESAERWIEAYFSYRFLALLKVSYSLVASRRLAVGCFYFSLDQSLRKILSTGH